MYNLISWPLSRTADVSQVHLSSCVLLLAAGGRSDATATVPLFSFLLLSAETSDGIQTGHVKESLLLFYYIIQ